MFLIWINIFYFLSFSYNTGYTVKMNPNKTRWILFATTKFNKGTETFQLTIDSMVKNNMEDKVQKLGVIYGIVGFI